MKNLVRISILLSLFLLLTVTSTAHGFSPGPFGGCTATNRTLFLTEPRLTGTDVLELQERLHELGYYKGKLDGIYGPKTSQAVNELQSSTNMHVTGQVGPATWEALSTGAKAPPVSTNDMGEPSGEVGIVIDTVKKTLTITDDGKPFKSFPCAVGKGKTPTPVGEWKVVHKGGNWGGGFGVRWMGLNVPWGVYGIHGTNKPYSIGTSASHGCIRMFNEHVRIVYRWVSVGTPVKIVGEPIMPPHAAYRMTMRYGAIGPDVVQVQLKLKEMGYLLGPADGRFGPATELAVKFFQVRNGMEDTGEVELEMYRVLGLKK